MFEAPFATVLIAACARSTQASGLFGTLRIPRAAPATFQFAQHGAQQASQKPAEPKRYVQRAFLRGLQLRVIVFALALYLGAEAVKALAKMLPTLRLYAGRCPPGGRSYK